MSDVDGPSNPRSFAIRVTATVINNPPRFSSEFYTFTLSENADDNGEVGLISVTDDSGAPIF